MALVVQTVAAREPKACRLNRSNYLLPMGIVSQTCSAAIVFHDLQTTDGVLLVRKRRSNDKRTIDRIQGT